ncbi:MAG: HD domain-containing protein [Bacillota bacterium]|nr:HD domain-containing protein [Bacillota bacterium]
MKLSLPEEVRQACNLLAEHRYQAFVVGGGVRDLLLGITPQDWDLATDARPQEVERLFKHAGFKVLPTGLRFGTLTVLNRDYPLEITTFRVEGDYYDFRRPDQVCFVGEIEADLARRDFTINAMAFDPVHSLLCDPFGGLRDLGKGTIKAVGDPEARISEDPLRMMRGIRLAAEFGFRVEEKTEHAIIRNAELIRKVSAERIRDELNRILMALHFMQGLELLQKLGLLFLIIPEIKESWLFTQYHPSHQFPVLAHTFEALRYTPAFLEVRLAVLLHDVAKPRCFSRGKDGRGHFYGHEQLGAEMAERILRRLRYSTQTIRRITILIREHMLDVGMTPAGMRRLIARVGQGLIPELLIVRKADFLAHSTELILTSLDDFDQFREHLQKILEEEDVLEMRDLAVSGADVLEILGCRPGPVVGRVLRALWHEVLTDPGKNNRTYLLARTREIAGELGDA